MIDFWWSFICMCIGGFIVWVFERYAWHKYYEGRDEYRQPRGRG